MEKLLSIVIPSYNMEDYLQRCLNSLILNKRELIDKLDIIVVNDGSKDCTSEIAHSYADRFPDSIRVIDKPNSHYGSCINAALPVATGKYFRILDADDWLDTSSLEVFLEKLCTIDADCVCTDFSTHYPDYVELNHLSDIEAYRIYDLNKELIQSTAFAMHRLTYRLDHLKSINYYQTEKVCYTDIEYVYYPLSTAKTFFYIPISLYQYFIGRDDQSVSFKSFYNNRNHYTPIINRILSSEHSERVTNANAVKIRKYVVNLLMYYYFTVQLLVYRPNNETSVILREILSSLKSKYNEEYQDVLNLKIRFIPFVRIWLYTGHLSNILLYPIRLRMRKNL